MTGPDDESKPMTRTELAMLWDLLGTWRRAHQPPGARADTPHVTEAVTTLLIVTDRELTERFGG